MLEFLMSQHLEPHYRMPGQRVAPRTLSVMATPPVSRVTAQEWRQMAAPGDMRTRKSIRTGSQITRRWHGETAVLRHDRAVCGRLSGHFGLRGVTVWPRTCPGRGSWSSVREGPECLPTSTPRAGPWDRFDYLLARRGSRQAQISEVPPSHQLNTFDVIAMHVARGMLICARA